MASPRVPRSDLHLLPVTKAISDSRKHGIGLVFALPFPGMVDKTFVSGAMTFISGPLHSQEEVFAARSQLGLSTRDQHSFFAALQERNFLLRQEGDLFPFNVGSVDWSETPWDDSHIDDRNRMEILREPSLAALLNYNDQGPRPKPQEISKDEFQTFLEIISKNAVPIVELIKLMPFGQSKFYELKRRALEHVPPLIATLSIKTGGTGHEAAVWVTSFAEDKYAVTSVAKSRGGDATHNWLLARLMQWYAKHGHEVRRESLVGDTGHPTDLLLDGSLPVELHISNSQESERQNVVANLSVFKSCLLVSNSRTKLEALRAILPEECVARTNFALVCEILNG